MIGFKDLKSIIVRSSRTTDDKNKSSDINNKFNFVINVDKLEKALNNKCDLHVVAFSKFIESRVPDISELQLISEYVHKREEINTIFDGKTQIATFMFYCDMDGALTIENNDTKASYSSKELSDMINSDTPNRDIATVLASEFPMYRTMVVRRFDNRKDKFVYSIYFRSSYSMITYINSLKEEGAFNNSADIKEEVEETPVEE
jgi:hypothetical protein